jgi:putative phosphoribosyl transferase
MRFSDRTDAGRLLGMRLAETAWINPVVYALPRGGVPVGLEVAKALNAPLDLLLVRKIGVPWQRELAAASVIDGEQPDIVFNEHVLEMTGISHDQILQAAKPELREIERRRILYLKGQAPISAKGRDAILVDDGIATGASLRAAIKSVRKRDPLRVVIAAPVASLDTAEGLRQLADEVICLSTPPNFYAIGPHYDDFHQLSDEEVVDLLKQRPETEEAESVSTN